MVSTRNSTLIKDELIRYMSSLGLTVNTLTKARGNRGFFKEGRIDISKILDDKTSIRVMVHEFAHYIHYELDKSLKGLDVVLKEDNENLREELYSVTAFVDKNASFTKLKTKQNDLKSQIQYLTEEIKQQYPQFNPCEKFKEFNNYSKHSDLKYLEKYDRVKINSFTTEKDYSIKNIKKDFPNIPDVFVNYLNLKSKQRTYSRISRRIAKLKKYYSEPCELFARFIEGLYMDLEKVKILAPNSYEIFKELYIKNYYQGLPEIFSIVEVII